MLVHDAARRGFQRGRQRLRGLRDVLVDELLKCFGLMRARSRRQHEKQRAWRSDSPLQQREQQRAIMLLLALHHGRRVVRAVVR